MTHNFLIQPTRAGSFTIPALTVTASGETLETKPLVPARPARRSSTTRTSADGGLAALAPGGRQRRQIATRAPATPHDGQPPRPRALGRRADSVELRLDIRADVQVVRVTPPELVGRFFTLTPPPTDEEPPKQVVTVGGVRYVRFSLPAALAGERR